MRTEYTKDSWAEQKCKLKARFLSLTNSDFSCETAKSNEMFTRVQIKFGKTREELMAILSGL